MSTVSFDAFWGWLQLHPNCVVRVGTPEAVLYDDEPLHWYIGPDQSALVIQLIRGKRLVGELVLDPERITYVQDVGEEREGEHAFEAIHETPTERIASYVFVVNHGMVDHDETESHGPVH